MDNVTDRRPPAALDRTEGEKEWAALAAETAEDVRHCVAQVVEAGAADLASIFYATLMGEEEAVPFLSHKMVSERLSHSMQAWLRAMFCALPDEMGDFADRQRKIGEVHARTRVPIQIMMRGARLLKTHIARRLEETQLGRAALASAITYVDGLIDIAIGLMSEAYVRDTKRGAQTDEAYRLFSLGQDVSLERESQRAALMEWSQALLFQLHACGGQDVRLPPVGTSDFGLWLHHKGSLLFQGAPALKQIHEILQRIDEELLPGIAAVFRRDPTELAAKLQELQVRIGEVKYLLSALFQDVATLENGRDPLTRALNRRFLPSILGREIAIANRTGSTFTVLMIDIDHFKQVNDEYGHIAGDAVLQQVAENVLEACRLSDFVFRYGGEEFLVVLVEADARLGLEIAERIRVRVAQSDVILPGNLRRRLTVSIGVASFDGHPDYTYLVNAADQALYQAKRSGRNRCVTA